MTWRRNAAKLGRVGHALGDIAGFIDMTEVEQGILPERGKDSSRRVDSLRSSAMGVLEEKKGETPRHGFEASNEKVRA